MKITNNLNIYTQVPPAKKKQNTLSPLTYKEEYYNDIYVKPHSYIKKIYKKNNQLKSIEFNQTMPISEAMNKISNSNQDLLDEFLLKLHSQKELQGIAQLLSTNSIGKTKVKGLVGMGAFAMSFLTEDGKILKITDIEHFPNNRKPADFDIPIIKQGKIGTKQHHYYYYIEEFATQNNLTQKEIHELVKHIKSLGYKMKDYLTHYDESSKTTSFRTEQFGRAKDGKIYLIDPGCAVETPLVYTGNKNFSFKHLLNKITKKIKNL